MARAVFETFGLFLAPFALFALFLALRARFPLAVEHWTRGRLSWLTLTINPHEVEAAFETPLAFLMDEANHEIHEREWSGRKRRYYAMPYEDRYIWGATAGMLRNLWERLFR